MTGRAQFRLRDRDVLRALKWLARTGVLPADTPKLLSKLSDWGGARPSQPHPDIPWRSSARSDPTGARVVARFQIGDDGKLSPYAADPTGSVVARLHAGVATVLHGMDIVKAALRELRPLSANQAQALLEEAARAANTCSFGCDVSGAADDRLRRGLCPRHYKEDQRARAKTSGDK